MRPPSYSPFQIGWKHPTKNGNLYSTSYYLFIFDFAWRLGIENKSDWPLVCDLNLKQCPLKTCHHIFSTSITAHASFSTVECLRSVFDSVLKNATGFPDCLSVAAIAWFERISFDFQGNVGIHRSDNCIRDYFFKISKALMVKGGRRNWVILERGCIFSEKEDIHWE